MPPLRRRVRLLDCFVQCGQKLRVIFAALVGSACAGFLFDERRPRLQSQPAEFLRRHIAQFSFDSSQAIARSTYAAQARRAKPIARRLALETRSADSAR